MKISRKVAAGVFYLTLSFISVAIVIAMVSISNPPQEQSAELISRQQKLSENNGPKLVLQEDAAETEPEETKYMVPLDEDVQAFAETTCKDNGVPAAVLFAMMYTESRFKADAVNDAGDTGLLQINNRYAAAYGATDLTDPYQNIRVGTSILAGYLKKYPDSLEKALMAYNCGPTRAAELWAEGITSTQYTEEVKAALWALKEKGEIEL